MKTFQQFSEEVSPFRNPKQWWNQGRNTRIPNENQASWKDLAKDDWKQRQGVKGAGGKGGWDPTRGFRVQSAAKGGLNSGPTPAVRQAFERPVRFGGKVLQTIGRGARAVGAVGSALMGMDRMK
jgi:hypothetical protein